MAKHEPIFFKRECLDTAMDKFLDAIHQEVDEKGIGDE